MATEHGQSIRMVLVDQDTAARLKERAYIMDTTEGEVIKRALAVYLDVQDAFDQDTMTRITLGSRYTPPVDQVER